MIKIRGKGRQFFEISYTDRKPDSAFLIAQKLGQLFLEIQEENRREESKDAYSFVDRQVKAYQSQLSQSENRLRLFLTENADGTEGEVQSKISQLKSQIELGELERSTKNSQGALKAFISKEVDTVRPPYSRVDVKKPRQSHFIATVNETDFLKDQTGNWWLINQKNEKVFYLICLLKSL